MATVASSRASATGSTLPDTSSTHPFTCNTCQVAFRNSELQRGHMRSDWHRYNLKRRVTSLPPIASEVFTEKVLQAQASSSAAASKASYERTCGACERTYFSENAYDNHLGSYKHRARVAAVRATGGYGDTEASSVMSSVIYQPSDTTNTVHADSDEEEVQEVVKGLKGATLSNVATDPISPRQPVPVAAPTSTPSEPAGSITSVKPCLERCLFCNYDSPTVSLNAIHMERIHGMFIPEKPYLVDLDGLVGSLYERIHEFHECLFCKKLKPTIYGLQTHMRDKGHCKIPFETEDEQLEIGEFYDFTSTYSDAEVDEDEEDGDEVSNKASGGAKLGGRRSLKYNEDDEVMEDGDGWETDSSASSLDSADLTAVPLDQHMHQYEKLDRHAHHSTQDPRPHHNRDGWHSRAHKPTHAAFYSDYELHLPSGRSVGHRALARYYRQNLHNHPTATERQEQLAIEARRVSDSDEEGDLRQVSQRNNDERGRALATRGNGSLGMTGVSDQKRKEVLTTEKRARKAEERERRRFQWGNNKQGNFQKHFRDPLLQ
ncbi:MAG: hypothetical protein M1818_006054 [Claussenomyces sp. TS43310]|nr:MAG: hypothetical protein M1818_006054 [Claussenomyces sp. TS43310]